LALTVSAGCTRPKPGLLPEEETPAVGEVAATPEAATAAPVLIVSPAAVAETPVLPAGAPAEETRVATQPTAALTPPLAAVVPTGAPTVAPVEITPFPTPGVYAAEEPTPVLATPLATPPATAAQAGQGTVYVVQAGDTLFSIAVRFGVNIDELRAVNGLVDDNIVPGQELIIPGVTGPGPTTGVVPLPAGGVHIVQPGDTVYKISRMYGTTVEAIASANGINPWFIFVGQRLIIPGPDGPLPQWSGGSASPWPGGPVQPGPSPVPTSPEGSRTHTVQMGETLFSIALLYGVSVQDIALANNLPNPNFIYPGQTLVIP
jgi:LysM repeat protein